MIMITRKAVNKYKSNCNYGKDTDNEAKLKILRMIQLGKTVYRYESKNRIIIQYFDMFITVKNHMFVVDIWKDKKHGLYKPSYDAYVRWNNVHVLESKKRW